MPRSFWPRATAGHVTKLSLALLALSCRSAPPERADVTEASPSAVIALPDEPLRFEVGAWSAPDWLKPLSASALTTTPQLGPSQMIAFGERVSVHRTSKGLLAVDAELGVVGPIALPAQSTWVGVDGEDQIWVGRHEDGALFRAASAKAASRTEAFELVLTLPEARAWDASGPFVVVATPSRVLLSSDQGRSFVERAVKKLDTLFQIYVRGDGVLVAQGESATSRARPEELPETLISTDGGLSWRSSPYQPGKLERRGSWIWSGDITCVAALTVDAKAWSADPDLSDLPGWRDPREAMLSLTDALYAVPFDGPIASTMTPAPAPNAPPYHEGVVASCQDPILESPLEVEAPGRDASRRGPREQPCQGVECLRGAAPEAPRAAREIYLLADATCRWPKGLPARAREPSCSAPGALVERAPHVVTWDHEDDVMIMEAAPKGCIPERVFNARGLHLIACREASGARLLARRAEETEGLWHEEARITSRAATLSSLSMSQDGTLILHGFCDRDRCAPSYLRQPLAAGAVQAWSQVALPAELLLTAIPLPGGNALVAARPAGDQRSRLELWWVDRGDSIRRALEVDGIEEPLRAMHVSEQLDEVTLELGDPLSLKAHLVLGHGELRARR